MIYDNAVHNFYHMHVSKQCRAGVVLVDVVIRLLEV